jgi:hypothetical protein
MALVPNAPTVALKSSTMWTLYAGILGNGVDLAIKVIQSPTIADAHLGWAQPALLVLMLVAAICRVIKQDSLQPPAIAPMPKPPVRDLKE